MGDPFFPGDIASRGGEHAGLVGGLPGRPAADRAFAQFVLGPVVGLLLDVDLDEPPGHLVARRAGDGFQLRELGASRKAVGVESLGQFPSHLTQAGVKLRPELGSILAHVHSPLQVTCRIAREAATSTHSIAAALLAVQSMSCARRWEAVALLM